MVMQRMLRLLGVEPDTTGWREKMIAAAGALLAIAATIAFGLHAVGAQAAALLVASMGASAVLLFAVPHGALSQPWPLLGGHVASALVGVSCARLIPDTMLAAPLAVALAVLAMYLLRCIHPPGGATALSAVVGGAQVHALGYQFVLTPVLLNVLVMLLVAVAVNYAFPWRRYPAALSAERRARQAEAQERLSDDDFAYALREVGSYVDVTGDELAKIYRLARKHALRVAPADEALAADNYYSNGAYGERMSVRKVLELDGEEVSYRIVAGEGEGVTGTAHRADFIAWQRYEVIPADGAWHRIMQL